MNKIFISIVVAFVFVGGLLIFQASRGGTSMVYLPSQILARVSEHAVGDQDLFRIRAVGRVTDESLVYRDTRPFKLSFRIADPNSESVNSIAVEYFGLKPDMFAPGRDVIIDGDYINGVFRASRLLTQCPSKYKPGEPGADNSQSSEALSSTGDISRTDSDRTP